MMSATSKLRARRVIARPCPTIVPDLCQSHLKDVAVPVRDDAAGLAQSLDTLGTAEETRRLLALLRSIESCAVALGCKADVTRT
jgi:hypothetical protein